MEKVTFGEVVDMYLMSKRGEWSETTYSKNTWLLTNLAKPLSNSPISEITPVEVLSVLRGVEASGRRESARRLRSAISRTFRHGASNLICDNDPTVLLRDSLKGPVVKSRAALTDPRAVGGLMRAIDEYDGWPTVRGALLFTALTFQRPGSVRLARWDDIDLEAAVWHIPKENMKGVKGRKLDHDVPLSSQAAVLINRMRRCSGGSEYVFPSIRSVKKTCLRMR